MNSINFLNEKKKFPLSTNVLNFLQDIIKLSYKSSAIVGTGNIILSGCENTVGNTWASGYVVINGELLPFMGGTGTVDTKVRIKETLSNVIADYDTYENALKDRVVEFGSNLGDVDTFDWSTFTRTKSIAEIVSTFATKAELDAVRLLVMPKGAIIDYDLPNNPLPLPVGWRFCDGSVVAGYGTLPDRKGRTTVGFDPDSNNLPKIVVDHRNPDGTVVQNYGAVGNMGGKPEVTLTKPEMPTHNHFIADGANSSDDAGGPGIHFMFSADPTGGTTIVQNTGNAGESKSHENRMSYVVGYHIVKIV